MTGTTKTGIMDLWSITDSVVDQPPPLSKELMEQHTKLQQEYQKALYRSGAAGKRASRSAREQEEVARANLRHFERRHGLTPSDPRIG